MSYYEYSMEKMAMFGTAAITGAIDKFKALPDKEKASFLGKVVKPSVAGVAIGALGLKMLYDKIQRDRQAKQVIDDLMRNDPIISKEAPDKVMQYAATVYNVAPSVTRDHNIMKNLLQNFIKFGTVDLQSIKMLVDIEKSMGDNNTKSLPFMASPMLGKLM